MTRLKPMMTLFRKLWFDGEISEAIKYRDKLLKKF